MTSLKRMLPAIAILAAATVVLPPPAAQMPESDDAALVPLAVRTLRKGLEEGPEQARECAWRGLVDIDGPEIQLLLEQGLNHPDRQVRIAAARTLRRKGDPAVIPIIERELLAGTWSVREEALRDLARVAGTESLPTLRRFLRSSQQPAPVRAAAADGLGMLHDDASVENLLGHLEEEREVLRFHALLALGEIGAPRAVEPLRAYRQELENPHERILTDRALALCGDPEGVARIERLLGSPSPRYRRLARQTLLQIGPSTAYRAYRRSLGQVEPPAQTELILALVEAGHRDAVPALRRLLDTGEPQVAAVAAAALARFGDRSGYRLLLDWLRESPWRYGDTVRHLLAGVEDRTITYLAEESFDDRSPADRFWAATILARFRHPGALRYLEREARRDDSPFQRRAAEVLADTGDWSVLPLLAAALDRPCPADERPDLDIFLRAPEEKTGPLLDLYLHRGTPLSRVNAAVIFLKRGGSRITVRDTSPIP